MAIDRRTFLGVTGAALLAAPLKARASGFSLDAVEHGKALKDPAGKLVLTYLTSQPAGLEANSACCIHPFYTLGGNCVTELAPSNHKDHRGIFFAWRNMEFKKGSQVVPADFWGGAAASADKTIINRDLRLVRSDARVAEIAVDNEWMMSGAPAMKESTTMVVSDAEGARILDLSYQFASDWDVTLKQIAYTGLCYRCRNDGDNTFFDSQGEVTMERQASSVPGNPASDWPARPWYSYQLTIPGGKYISAALFNHGSNPRTLWHGNRSVAFLQPCIAAPGDFTIPAGKPLTLRYRLLAYDGRFPAGMLDRMASAWGAKA